MTADLLPAPLVPPDVDLRGMEWMPYYGDRLGRSEFNARVDDTTWRAGHNLWWAAWNNVPAASLPNVEVSLTRFADLGRDIKTFQQLREQALHGFIECNDGRLYHPFLASLALAAWERRLSEREKKRKWRERKSGDGTVPKTGTEPGRRPGHREGTEPSRPRAGDRAVHVSGTVERRGEDRKEDVPYGTSSVAKATGGEPPFDPIKALWDRSIAVLGEGSRTLIGKARREYGDIGVLNAIARCEAENPSNPLEFFLGALRGGIKKTYPDGIIPMHPGAGG